MQKALTSRSLIAQAIGKLIRAHREDGLIKDAGLASPALTAFKAILADARSDPVLREEIFAVGLKQTHRGAKVEQARQEAMQASV